MKDIQLTKLFAAYDKLQDIHWDKTLRSVYGAGQLNRPTLFLLFMNPTWRNVSCIPWWKWIHAPRLWTKNIRKLLAAIWSISKTTFEHIQKMRPNNRTEQFSLEVYKEIADNNTYISNLAKCTQTDARPLPDGIFKEYLDLPPHYRPGGIKFFFFMIIRISKIIFNKKQSLQSPDCPRSYW